MLICLARGHKDRLSRRPHTVLTTAPRRNLSGQSFSCVTQEKTAIKAAAAPHCAAPLPTPPPPPPSHSHFILCGALRCPATFYFFCMRQKGGAENFGMNGRTRRLRRCCVTDEKPSNGRLRRHMPFTHCRSMAVRGQRQRLPEPRLPVDVRPARGKLVIWQLISS